MGSVSTYPTNQGASAFDRRLRMWTARRQRSQELKQIHETAWLTYWDWYRNVVEPLDDPADWWRSNEAVPTVFKIVETLLPRYVLGMFDSPDWFTVEGRNYKSEMYEHLCYNLLRQAVEEMNIFPKVVEAMRYCTIMGHVWGKVIWREEYEQRQVLKPTQLTMREALEKQDIGEEGMRAVSEMYGDDILETPSGETGVEAVIQEEEVFNGPDFEWRSLDRIFPDPSGRERWYIEEIHTTLEELEDTQDALKVYDPKAILLLRHDITVNRPTGEYGGLDNIGDARSGTTAGVSIEYAREPETTEGIPEWIVTPMRDGRGVSLWQCWGWVPPEQRKDGVPWRLVVIAEGKYILRDVPSPTPTGRPPYFPIRSISIPGRLYGESVLRYVGPLMDQQTRLANMRLDEVFLGVWQQYLFRKDSVVSDNALLMQPGGAIEVMPQANQSISDTFSVLPRREILSDVWREDDWRQTQAEDAAAAGDIIQGVGGGGTQTATEVERKLQQGNARHVLQVMINDYTFKKELLERTWRWLQMRLTKPKFIRMQGDQYASVDLSMLETPIDIVVSGGLFALSKETRLQMDQELIQLSESPVYGPYMKPDAILKRWVQDRGWKNPDAFVKSEEDVQLELYTRGVAQAKAAIAQQNYAQTQATMGGGMPQGPGGAQGPPGGGGQNANLPPELRGAGTPPTAKMPKVQLAGQNSSLAGRNIVKRGDATPPSI